MNKKAINPGWRVVIAGTSINLILGALYTWSIFKSALEQGIGLNAAQTAIPYTVECLVFAFCMVPAGRLQDVVGPRIGAMIGGALVGSGFVIASFATTAQNAVFFLVFGYGVLTGAGTAFAYAATTPSAVKWFPSRMHGLIVGIVVGGVGMASVWAAPLISFMIASERFDVSSTFRTLGICFFIAIVTFAQFLRDPAPGEGALDKETTKANDPAVSKPGLNYGWKEMMRTPQFLLVWIMFSFGAGAGLMLISFVKSMASGSLAEIGFVLVAMLAFGNASGRFVSGVVSDKLGRSRTLLIVFLLQACVLVALSRFGNVQAVAMVGVVMVGFNYGSCLSVFPSITADYFGLKNLGMNFGIVFTAWGVGSMMALVAGKIKVMYDTYTPALVLSAGMCVVAATLTFVLKPPAAGKRDV